MAEALGADDPELNEQYERFVSQAKQEARNGNLEESLRLFRQAHQIYPCEKLTRSMKKLEEALASLALDQEEHDFVDVYQSGLMLSGEIHDKLFDYQREGVAFLYSLYRDRRKGGILADDMGLGKTIQVIAFLTGMFDEQLIRFVLLIVPSTLLSNWVKEFSKWAPGLHLTTFHGPSKPQRIRNLERIQKGSGILLTTYRMVLYNWQQLSSLDGNKFIWDYIILDEAHKIKTPSAKTTKSVHAISSLNRILLTGTPVQNNLKELWALFDFACQGSLLGTMKTFEMEYEKPIIRARTKDATQREKALGLKISENLMSIIKPYFLRRSKVELQNKVKPELKTSLPEDRSKTAALGREDQISLPRKNDFIVWVYLSPIQKQIYRDFLSLDHIQELLMSSRNPLAELSVLKKLCDHPRLLSARVCSKLGLEDPICNKVGGNENGGFCIMKSDIGHISDEILMAESGKLCFLVTLLERLQEEGHKTLVFSHTRKMLDIIEHMLTHRGLKLMRIDGTVGNFAQREQRIAEFQNSEDYSVFLLTTQVGGVGLTLTAATRVVIFDPSWNPAADAQAVDRVYRIGQKENVVIYRLISCGTVEEKIYRRQVFKGSLIQQSTGDRKDPYRYFTMQELRELFTLEDTSCSITQIQLQSLHAGQRNSDPQLDKHFTYLHSLGIFGISDHDLLYTQEPDATNETNNKGIRMSIEHRVQKAQELIETESKMNDQLMGSLRNTTEGMREMESKKPPEPSPNYALVPPVTVEPTNSGNTSFVCDGDDDIVNVSSKMAELLIEEDERVLQDISNMDNSVSINKDRKPTSRQEVTPLSSRASSLSYKENCSPQYQMVSHDPPTEENGKFNDAQGAQLRIFFHQEPDDDQQTTQSHCPISPFPQAHLSYQVNCNSEAQMICHNPPVEASGMFNDVQAAPLQRSEYISNNDDKEQSENDMSLNVPTSPHGEAGEVAELGASVALQLQTSKMSDFSFAQKSGMSGVKMGNESLTGYPQCETDFRLVLEDCEGQMQDISGRKMPVAERRHTTCQRQLNSHCSSESRSWLQGNGDNRNLQAHKSIMGSMVVDDADNVSLENSELSFQHKNVPVAIMISDSEEDDDYIRIDQDDRQGSPINKRPVIMSTPKSKLPTASLCFSPRVKISGRRSTAFRKSLANILDEVEDIADTIESTVYISCEDFFQLHLESEET